MRLLAVLLFWSSLALYLDAEPVKFSPETHGNYYEKLEPEVSIFKRVKRAAVGIASACEPGWTGQYCENPMCNKMIPSMGSTFFTRMIDNMHLPLGCTGKYYVPVDSLSAVLKIHVNAPGIPWINLTDSNGNLVAGSIRAQPDYGYATYPPTLAPGAYQLTIDNGGLTSGECRVNIEIDSNLGMDMGWVMSPQSDMRPAIESGYAGVPMYFITHLANLTSPGQVKAVTIRNSGSMIPVYRSVLTTRYGCGFEYYAGTFSCSTTESYMLHVDGVDQNGYAWRRAIGYFGCLYEPTTTLAPTTPPILQTCYNGGSLLLANTINATCFCPELWTGNQCLTPNCMNGGNIDPSGLICECPDGFAGDNCQDVYCDPNWGQYLTDYKTLVVVVRTVQSMNQYANSIIAAIKSEMEDNDGLKNGLYQNYVLVRYVNGDYLEKEYSSSGYSAFMADLNKIANSTIQGNCSDVIFDSLYSLFVRDIYEKSAILHFTDAVASDIDGWRLVSESNSRRNLPIYTHFFPQAGCGFDEMNLGYQAIQKADMNSGGLTYEIPSSVVGQSLTHMIQSNVRLTARNMNLIYANDLDRCSASYQRSFLADSSTDSIIIFITGKNAIFSVVDPDNDPSYNPLFPLYNDGQNYAYEITIPKTGEYVFSLQTANQQNPCSIRVVSKSDFDFFFATSFAIWYDAIDSVPVVGQPFHLVAQLNGLYNATKDPFRLFAELTITTNQNKDNNSPGKPMYYSNGIYRDNCGYHLYFGVADFCEYDLQPFYATIFADDNNGYTIQRTTIGFCSIYNTTTNSTGVCMNGGAVDPTNNQTCICQVGFTGTYCQQIVCQNGGTPAGTFCICVPGSTGTFCELYTCPDLNLTPDGSFTGQTMVFVVAVRQSMQATWNLLSQNVDQFVKGVKSQDPNWIDTWTLITVSADDTELIVTDHSSTAFAVAIKTIAANLSAYYNPGLDNCQVQLMQGMYWGALKSNKRSSIYVFSDASGPDDATTYPALYNLITQYALTINIIQASPRICTSSGVMDDYIQDLAFASSGFFYMTSQIDQMLPYITSMFMSGVSGEVMSNDCSVAPAYQYVAIDGQTESFTISAIGANLTGMEVFLPDGSSATNGPYEIIMVSTPNLYIRQYISACPQGAGWNFLAQTCLSFGATQYSWLDASKYCHSIDGALVDINNQNKQDKVHFNTQGADNWIGLIRSGNGWIWDVPNGADPQPLDANSFSQWENNYPTADQNKNCVFMNQYGNWQNEDCSLVKYIVCEKHRFGSGFAPDDPNAIAVPPGRWLVKISSGSDSCYGQVRSQSLIQIFQGFVQDPHDDYPELYPNSDSVTNYIAINPTGISQFQGDGIYNSMEANLNYAIIGYNGNLTNPLTIANRWGCGYPYISQPFGCPQTGGNNFFIKYSGIDQHGYAFNRYLETNCNKYVYRCNNGGFLNNGACVCRPGWTGKTCYNPICQNNGVDNGAGGCKCFAMFTGTFCELPKCEPPFQAIFGDKARTLAILLETSYGMGNTIWLMQRNLKAALDSIQNDPSTAGWFTQFILYPFDSTSNKASWYNYTVSSSSDDIVAAVKNINTGSCPGVAVCDSFCPRPYLDVLEQVMAMDAFAYPNSVILIITRSTPANAANQDRVNQLLQETRAQVNFVLPAIDSPCGEGWNSPGVYNMYRTVQYSDGNIFVMSPADLCSTFIPQYIPTLYRSAGLESASLPDCGNADVLFQIEHEMYEFTLDYYAPQTNPPIKITVTDPSGDDLTLPQNLITSDSNYVGVFRVNDTGAVRAGTYKISLRGPSVQSAYCYMNVRGRSSIELYPGFVSSHDGYNGAITDTAHYAPVLLDMNTVVVHADGLVAAGGILTYAQFIDTNNIGLYHTTYLLPRNTINPAACTYEWYGQIPIDWQFTTLLMVIYGRDGKGANFHRNYLVTGVPNRPAPKPAPPTCEYNLVKQDIIFMIDSSLKNDASTFKILTSFASNVMSPYPYGPNNVQPAALTVSDVAYGGFSFYASQSWSDFNKYVNNLTYSAKVGQNTALGFNYIIANYTSENQGYRSNSSVYHSIFYLTNTDPTDTDAGEVPYTLRRSGQFGIAVVAFNMSITDNLRKIAGPDYCIYESPDIADLNNYAVNFVRQFSCSEVKTCGMK